MKKVPGAADASQYQNRELLAVNTSAPIDQIWCVHQDRDVSRETVSQILNLNEIQVQRQQPPSSVYANKEPAEAFYVAATRQQMMLAMSQISNNADVEMIQLPSAGNSPIADAIAQQFSDSGSGLAPVEPAMQQRQAVAPGFHKPKSQALAQQLFANSLPRNFVPQGPVPPILNADSDLGAEFRSETKSEALEKSIAMKSKDASLPRPLSDAEEDGNEIMKKGIASESNDDSLGRPEVDAVDSPALQMTPQRQADTEELEDNSDEQLRQYLILVRGGEEEK